MIDDELLRLAVERGILDSAQAERLAALADERTARAGFLPDVRDVPDVQDVAADVPDTLDRPDVQEPAVSELHDDEKLRLVSGFGDIFVTIGLALFLGAAGYFAGLAGSVVKWATIAALAWLLAEFFTRRRRMALPSIALLVVFASASFMTVNFGLGGAGTYQPGRGWFINTLGLDLGAPLHVAISALATAGFVALHYTRFRVPITIAAGAAAIVGAALAVLFAIAPEFSRQAWHPLLLTCGLAVFALAMWFDMADPGRATRRTDIAFWLHLLAAPLIVHPLVAPLVFGAQAHDLGSALTILAVFLALGLVAVVIDRRAMLVSGLTYAGVAFGTIISKSGLGGDRIVPATLLALGAFILLLSAGWAPLRARLLHLLPAPLSRRLPNPLIEHSPISL
jgi:hypothetical protein